MEGQDSVGTGPVTEQPIREQSPLRTLSYVFGLGQFAGGTGQYVFAPVATSSVGRMVQGVDCQNDGITDISRMQNSPPIGSNMEVGEDDNFVQEQDHCLSYVEEVVDRFPPEEVKQMVVLLIAYIESDVPIEKWQELVPDQIVQSARKMLKARDDAVVQTVRNLHMTLDKSHEKGRRLAQEVLGEQDGQRLTKEGEQQTIEEEKVAKYEVDELTHRLEECDQTIEELNAEITSTTKKNGKLSSTGR